MDSPDSPGPLTRATIALAKRAEQSTDRRLADIGRQSVERLRAPLCVAVVGRMSSGKSTLLNALLGVPVAPTDATECTKVVTVFRHGRSPLAVLHPRDGRDPIPVRFDRHLPADFDRPAAEIKSIEVRLPAPRLQRMTLVDTPGLASLTGDNAAATQRMLDDTVDSAAHADALLFCVNGPLLQDEEAAIRAFASSRTAQRRLNCGTAVGLLTKADSVVEDVRESWKASTRLAGAMAEEHAGSLMTVLPVVGLLAQTDATGALREPHIRALSALADAWSLDVVRTATSNQWEFLGEPAPIDDAIRRELLALLGLYGVGELLERIQGGLRRDATSLRAVIQSASGFEAVMTYLRTALRDRTDALKAASALGDLVDNAHRAGERALYDEAIIMLERPAMLPVKLIEVAQQVSAGRVRLPLRLRQQVWLAARNGGLPACSPAEAARATGDWRSWAMLADGAGQQVAQVMVRAWALAATGARR
jgi:hypothetical protein